jgi:hypothetical protein
MKGLRLVFVFSVVVALCTFLPAASGQEAAQGKSNTPKLRAYTTVVPAPASTSAKIQADVEATGVSTASALPLFTYHVKSTRDGNSYSGVMVGSSPFGRSGSTPVATFIIPVKFVLRSVGVGFNPNTGIITTAPGITTFDPTVADDNCLSSPNDVPLTVFQQSPLFDSFDFNIGGVDMGTTQYIDAFQRGNFWNVENQSTFHTTLGPIKTLAPFVITIPRNFGTTLPQKAFPSCGPFGIVDFFFLKNLLTGTILPELAAQGVNSSNFPIFLMYNVVLASPVTNLGTCCILGFHGAANSPVQTYSPIDFDSTGLFGPTISDTSIGAHEIGEWMDDPFGNNPVPPWGHIGQQPGCQGNLEVGDPLTGTNFPNVLGTNGFTYHLQELVFFSWFYGAPSIGVNGMFSDNGTFTTDAGPACQ